MCRFILDFCVKVLLQVEHKCFSFSWFPLIWRFKCCFLWNALGHSGHIFFWRFSCFAICSFRWSLLLNIWIQRAYLYGYIGEWPILVLISVVLAYLNMIRPASSDDLSTLALVWKYSERHEHDQRMVQAEIANNLHKLCIIEHSLEDLWKMLRWLCIMLRINVSVKVSFFVKIFITLLAFKYRLYMGMLDGNVRI